MRKVDLILEIAKNTGIDKKIVEPIVEDFMSTVKDSLANGNNIYLRGFGSFINKRKATKMARNIKMKTPLIIDAHFAPKFKPSNVFINQVKENVLEVKNK